MGCNAWDAKVETELISDADMYLFFGKGMIEFLAFLRYSNPKQESKHIVYLDANNFYGYAISQFLSAGGFQLVDPKRLHGNKYNSNISKFCV